MAEAAGVGGCGPGCSVELPVPRHARFRAIRGHVHAFPDLLHGARHSPDADLVQQAVGGVAGAVPRGNADPQRTDIYSDGKRTRIDVCDLCAVDVADQLASGCPCRGEVGPLLVAHHALKKRIVDSGRVPDLDVELVLFDTERESPRVTGIRFANDFLVARRVRQVHPRLDRQLRCRCQRKRMCYFHVVIVPIEV